MQIYSPKKSNENNLSDDLNSIYKKLNFQIEITKSLELQNMQLVKKLEAMEYNNDNKHKDLINLKNN